MKHNVLRSPKVCLDSNSFLCLAVLCVIFREVVESSLSLLLGLVLVLLSRANVGINGLLSAPSGALSHAVIKAPLL